MAEQTPWLYERTWPEVRAYLERDDVILLPVGSTEQHGLHLPLMTDAAEAIAVARGAGEKARVLVAPPVWYGWTPHHMGYPGTVTLRADTLTAVIEDVCQSLFHHGFRRIIIINGHRLANLPPLEIAAVKVRNRTGGYILIFDLALSTRVEMAAITSGEPGAVGHACEDETSQMLHSHGDLVKMGEARRAVHPPAGRFNLGGFATVDPAVANVNFAWRPLTPGEFSEKSGPTGASGDPTLASPEKGRSIFEAQVSNVCELIAESRRTPVTMRPFDIPI
jgi:creatinine amidohydrolase